MAGSIGASLLVALDTRKPVQRLTLAPPAPPLPPENTNKPLTADQAVAANAVIATSAEPIEAAASFVLAPTIVGELSRSTALDCMTAAIYYEAASETFQGQRAVAQVILNRVRHPAFPHSVCGVVYQGSERSTGCQFSFTCDGSLARRPSRAGWDRAAAIAAAALSGVVEPSVGTATHYHTVWVVPYWASSLTKITTVGAHIFYRWSGFWGKRSAFSSRYTGEIQEAAVVATEPADAVDGSSMAAQAIAEGVAAVPSTGLLADDRKSESAVVHPGEPMLSADRQSGKLIVDEAAGLRPNAEEAKRDANAVDRPAPVGHLP